jgi:hypothetical protein
MSWVEFAGGRGSRHADEAMASLRRYVELVELAQAGDRDADRIVSRGERVVRELNIRAARRALDEARTATEWQRKARALLDAVARD